MILQNEPSALFFLMTKYEYFVLAAMANKSHIINITFFYSTQPMKSPKSRDVALVTSLWLRHKHVCFLSTTQTINDILTSIGALLVSSSLSDKFGIISDATC